MFDPVHLVVVTETSLTFDLEPGFPANFCTMMRSAVEAYHT